jgi:hypothetical protein
LYLGVVAVAGAVILHVIVPCVVMNATEAFPGPGS